MSEYNPIVIEIRKPHDLHEKWFASSQLISEVEEETFVKVLDNQKQTLLVSNQKTNKIENYFKV
jgi:hypothetical protein